MAELDDIDRKLLHILQDDGRTPYAELGQASASPSPRSTSGCASSASAA